MALTVVGAFLLCTRLQYYYHRLLFTHFILR